ncbi:MAG: hypothetical protein KAT25_00255 [Sulfuriflexus sp.]|nr:hypothetical protein [Sulfuriflexus sp.]
MTLKNLDNLVKINKLKIEPPDQIEFDGMVCSAKRRLQDAKVEGVSEEGRFLLAYGAAHVLSLAAMRWHGYRSDNRYLVFQCLEHTIGFEKAKWRLLAKCHNQRNLAEYEGHLEITPQLLKELVEITTELLAMVENLEPVS